MAKRIVSTTPKQDGFYMPGEFEPQERVWMLWHALVRPGEVACIYTEDPACPFYGTAQKCYQQLCGMTDAKGRRLKVHRVCCPAEPVRIEKDFYSTGKYEEAVLETGQENRRDENGTENLKIVVLKTGQKEDKAMRNVTVAATQTVLVQSFDLDEIEEYRRSWGVWRDRRPEMYGILTTHGK